MPAVVDLPLFSAEGAAAPLTCFGQGQQVCIAAMALAEDEATRLREMGLCEGACVRLMTNAALCVVGLGACRIALRHEVAAQLFATETS